MTFRLGPPSLQRFRKNVRASVDFAAIRITHPEIEEPEYTAAQIVQACHESLCSTRQYELSGHGLWIASTSALPHLLRAGLPEMVACYNTETIGGYTLYLLERAFVGSHPILTNALSIVTAYT